MGKDKKGIDKERVSIVCMGKDYVLPCGKKAGSLNEAKGKILDRATFTEHSKTCPACRTLTEKLKSTYRALQMRSK